MTNHRATAEHLADLANSKSSGARSRDIEARATSTALATEGLVHAVLALTAEVRDWRGDIRIDQPPLTVYRASCNGFGLGFYASREAARDHCIADATDMEIPALGWITEADSDTDELHSLATGTTTGHCVDAVEVADEYDPDAGES